MGRVPGAPGRRVALMVTGVLLLAACGDDDSVPAQADQPQAATRVTVTCTADTTSADQTTVQASADGVHLTVVDESGRDLEVRAEALDEGERDSAAGPLDAADGEHVAALPPGPYLLLCSERDGPEHMRSPSETDEAVALEVVDPDGTWVPAVLDCGDGMIQTSIGDYAAGTEGERGDPLAIATDHLVGILGADGEVRQAGYPDPSGDGITYVFERDGRTRGIATAQRAGAGWLVPGETVCAEDL